MKTIRLNTAIPLTQISYYRFNWCIYLILIPLVVAGQDLSYLQEKYPGQTELVTDYTEHYHLSVNKNNQLIITQDNYEEMMIITDKGAGFSTSESIFFSDFHKILSYDAYTLNTINNKQRKTNVAQITEKKLDYNGVFDSDVKLKIFNFSNLNAGSKKVLKYNIEFVDPFLLHRFMFANHIANKQRTLKISHSDAIKIDYKLFNITPNELNIKKEVRKGITTITFQKTDPSILKKDNDAVGNMYEAPHLHFWITEYQTKNGVHSVLGTADKLFDYYNNFITQINQKESSDLKKFTLELIKDDVTNEDKLKTIFSWVQKNIKYIAFESGYEGFIPRDASLVFERKFGDCKDMTSIITEMAKYANVPNVNFTWIGTRELPYTYEQLPTPAVDNHMIASYIKDKEIIYLDATNANIPFGLPSGFIQGKEALIAQGNTYILSTVPEVSAEINYISDQVELTLENQKIIGKGTYLSNGLVATMYRNIIGDNARKRKDFVFSLLEKGNNKFKLINFEEIDFSNNNKPYKITYNFELDNYLVTSGNEVYINLTLGKPFQNETFETSRSQTFDHGFLHKRKHSVLLQTPSNSQIVFLPEKKSFSNELLSYTFEYSKLGTNILLEYEINIKQTLIPPLQFSLWNESIKKLKENYLETIIIKQK